MPEHLRALVVILVLATAVFVVAKKPVCEAGLMREEDFVRRRNLWYGLTLAAFLSHDFWIYIVVAAVMLAFAGAREKNKMAMFFFVLFAVPQFREPISGFGLLQHLFDIDHLRLLSLAVLFPALIGACRAGAHARFGSMVADRFLITYFALNIGLQLTVDTATNSARHGFYFFLDVFLPYYVASRSLRTLPTIRDALASLLIPAVLLGAIGVFEFLRGWLLYQGLENALQLTRGLGAYLYRDGALRSMGSVGHSIALGYVMVIAIAIWWYFRDSLRRSWIYQISGALMFACLIASLSRGPWLGLAMLAVTYAGLSRRPLQSLLALGAIATVGTALLTFSPGGDRLLAYLPFVGTVDEYNIDYRRRLLYVALDLIAQNPVFGSFSFLHTPEMQSLRQGQGIVDIVNTYVGVALTSGLVGLTAFTGALVSALFVALKCMCIEAKSNKELRLLGQTLASTTVAILAIIFTVSSITIIPVLYWSIAGLGLAYARLVVLRALRPQGAVDTHLGSVYQRHPARSFAHGVQQ